MPPDPGRAPHPHQGTTPGEDSEPEAEYPACRPAASSLWKKEDASNGLVSAVVCDSWPELTDCRSVTHRVETASLVAPVEARWEISGFPHICRSQLVSCRVSSFASCLLQSFIQQTFAVSTTYSGPGLGYSELDSTWALVMRYSSFHGGGQKGSQNH